MKEDMENMEKELQEEDFEDFEDEYDPEQEFIFFFGVEVDSQETCPPKNCLL
jgi:hypothetical protein